MDVEALARVLLGGQLLVPVPDHADLAEGEGDEDADDVQLDEPGGVGAVDDDQQGGGAGQQDDAVGEGEAVAAGVELARQVRVAGEDRAQQREAVEGGVGRQEEDERGGDGEQDEEEGAVAEDRGGDLGDHRLLDVVGADRHPVVVQVLGRVLGHADAGLAGQGDDAAEHGGGEQAHQRQRGGGVAALGAAEGGDAVADRLDAGERGAAGGEGAQQQEDEGEAREARVLRLDLELRGGRGHGLAEDQAPDDAPDQHEEDAADEDVGGDGEELARLPDAAQVHHREQGDGDDRAERLVLDDEGDGRPEVLDAGGDRHGHGQHVVDEEGAGDGASRPRAQVGLGHLVGAAAVGVGVHGLPIGGDHGGHQDHHRQRDPGAEVVRRRARQREDQQHLAGRVGDRGERVGGEDGEGDPLGEEGLPQLVAGQCAPDEEPFGHVGQFGHVGDRKRSPRPPPRSRSTARRVGEPFRSPPER